MHSVALAVISLPSCNGASQSATSSGSQEVAPPSTDGAKSAELFTLRVVDPPFYYLEFVTAWELGFFEDAGINIEFIGDLSGITNYTAFHIKIPFLELNYTGYNG
ncbi:MAG: hypothetical protein LBU32_32295 [Clostridiales bacterium]|nr:hypothetical protein [Clostridiales bacterium]